MQRKVKSSQLFKEASFFKLVILRHGLQLTSRLARMTYRLSFFKTAIVKYQMWCSFDTFSSSDKNYIFITTLLLHDAFKRT